jgi:hypothetical protein
MKTTKIKGTLTEGNKRNLKWLKQFTLYLPKKHQEEYREVLRELEKQKEV